MVIHVNYNTLINSGTCTWVSACTGMTKEGKCPLFQGTQEYERIVEAKGIASDPLKNIINFVNVIKYTTNTKM